MGSSLGNELQLSERAREDTVHARVLVVEDEHLVALDIKLRVESMGHTAEIAYSGESALERVSERGFDLVLMDIKLKGGLDGIDAARQLRVFDIPVIYLTAYADTHTLERARMTEPYGYVLKPFQERELKAAIEMALQRHSSDRQRTVQQQVQRFLAEASASLAGTLDYRAVAHRATELMVPRYADWCTIHLCASNDQIPELTCTRPDGHDETNGHRTHSPVIDSVQSTGHSEIVTQIQDASSLVDALGSQHLDTLRGLGARSLICVPLRARDQILGTLALVAGRGRPRYSTDDLVLAEDFGYRLALAFDNALLYRAAERAIRMRDDVLAVVSHDLRTPLGTILLQAEALVENPELRTIGASIMRSAQRMHRLIGDLLDASAINAGQLALELGAHSAAEVAREALEMFRSQAEARQIRLVEELPTEPRWIQCDRDRIVQVLSNLLGNAIKFTRRDGTVTVRVTPVARSVSFEVQDTGPGIPPEQVPYLFDRFWRGQTRHNGAGLGLFIARGIMDAHGSTLGVDSTLGVGSRFHFSLPEANG